MYAVYSVGGPNFLIWPPMIKVWTPLYQSDQPDKYGIVHICGTENIFHLGQNFNSPMLLPIQIIILYTFLGY